MENHNSKYFEQINLNKDFIIRKLNLISEKDGEMLKIDTSTDAVSIKDREGNVEGFNNIEDLSDYFKDIPRKESDRVSRPFKDSTFFTTAGIQHLETLIREKGGFEKEKFAIFQPVIRSQFIDKVSEGTSTSFVNFSIGITESTPNDFISICNEFIHMLEQRGIKVSDLRFNIESNHSSHGEKIFDNISVSVFFQNVELGECVYIYDYPVGENKKIPITDFGFGVERLNWAIKKDADYLPEFSEIYSKYKEIDKNKLSSIFDAVRSMVLIAGDGVVPSGKDHGYRLRQFSKRFIDRNKALGLDIEKMVHLSFDEWNKWGNKASITKENVVKVIKTENDRNFNSLFLVKLKESKGKDIYIEINQSMEEFLAQMEFSIPSETINNILNQLKQ